MTNPGSTLMNSAICPSSCISNAQCAGATKSCNWKTCSSGELCNVSHTSTIPINQSCPTGCSADDECSTTISGTAIIASSCGVDSAVVTANVAGGITPYKKYTWYKQIGSGAWTIDYEQICPAGGCNNSHIYLLSGQTINVYLRVEDNKGDFWASNILSINCSDSGKCGCNGTTKTCDASGTGASCSDISSCPLCGTATNKCGINPNGSMFCGTGTLGLSGTGGSCNFASDCGACKKR